MNARTAIDGRSRRDLDPVPTLTIVIVGALALIVSWLLPWWRMEARAPQYGKQVLVVDINPSGVTGDVAEIDALGHYVGIKPMTSYAKLERALGPYGMAAAFVGFLVAPFLPRRRWRTLALLPVLLLPLAFCADLAYWINRGSNMRDPGAALSLTVPHIETRLFGSYAVGQFQIEAIAGAGLFGVTTVSLLSIGLLFAAPLPLPWRRRRAVLAAAAVACLAATAQAGEHRVPSGGSIAAVLARAEPGDRIVVPAGRYAEHLVIDKPLALAGEPGAVLDGGDQGTILDIRADGVSVADLELTRSGSSYLTEDAGIRIENAREVRLERLRLSDVLFGIFAVRADDCVIDGLSIVGKDLPHTRRGDSIRLWYSHRCAITGNQIERGRDFIIWYSQGTHVERNVVRNSRYGLHYMYSHDNVFRHNRFEHNQVGAAVMYSRNVTFSENTFSFSDGPSAYGALLKDADDIFVHDNRFVGNAAALYLDGAPQSRGGRVEVRANLLARNGVGLIVEPHNHNAEIWDNAFVGNRVQVRVAGSGDANGNRWACDGRGNYWSDAMTYDRDGDGISDLPLRQVNAYEALADAHPQLAFFESTIAAETLDMAARLFPIFEPRPKLTDPHPLVRASLKGWAANQDSEVEGASPLMLAGACLMLGGSALVWGAQRAIA